MARPSCHSRSMSSSPSGPAVRRRGNRPNAGNAGTVYYTGPFGTYYREVFFHIPLLIASQLNGQQRFAAAERWYRHVFDPTADEVSSLGPGRPVRVQCLLFGVAGQHAEADRDAGADADFGEAGSGGLA